MTRAVDNRVITPGRTERPIIYNGDMLLAERGTSATNITAGGYPTVDRFYLSMSSAGTFTQTQSTDVPTGQGFTKSLKWDCTSANGSLSSGSYLLPFEQHFEGQDLQLLRKGTSSAKEITIAFWIKSNLTGNFNLEIWDRENDRQITRVVTIDSADTWEKKVSSFPGDTTGTLTADNSNRLQIALWAGGGTNFTSGGSLQTSWGAITHTKRAYNTVNLASSTDNELYITGVQLEIGDYNTTTLPPFQFEDAATSLARCQRYFISHTIADGTRLGDGIFRSTTRVMGNIDNTGLLHNMRGTPSVATTITSFQVYHGSDTTTNSAATSGTGFTMSGTHEVRTDFTFSSGSTTAGLPGKLRANSAGAMEYDAEI